MTTRRWVLLIAAALLLAGAALYSYQRGADVNATRAALLGLMPADASTVFFADVSEVRNSAFLEAIYNWAPHPQMDPEYARFARDTGFDYERDLDRVALAVITRGNDTAVFAVADGRFDRQKIEAYASQAGSRVSHDGRPIFSMPLNGASKNISVTFLRDDRIALSDSHDLQALLKQSASSDDVRQWQQRFERLAGSPVFAVIRQDSGAGSAFASRAPGGLQSPQLASLLNQLSWITVAGKPDQDRLRIVAEGECLEDRTARQLNDLLNGMLVMAHAGLNGPDLRRGLDPKARDAYLEILRSADVTRIDRDETKSVRVVLDVTPKLLEAASSMKPAQVSSPSPAAESIRTTRDRGKSHKTAR